MKAVSILSDVYSFILGGLFFGSVAWAFLHYHIIRKINNIEQDISERIAFHIGNIARQLNDLSAKVEKWAAGQQVNAASKFNLPPGSTLYEHKVPPEGTQVAPTAKS